MKIEISKRSLNYGYSVRSALVERASWNRTDHEESHPSPSREGPREKYHCICRMIAVGWNFN